MSRLDQALDSLYALGPAAAEVRAAQARLQRRLRAVEPEVYYDKLDRSPLGVVYLATGKRGLLAVGLATDERAFTQRVKRATGAEPVRSPERLREARRQMEEYLGGERASFRLAIDLHHAPAFQRSVLDAARRIPRGRVLTYGDLASRMRRPRAGRAVGQALAHNPLPVVVPCHRVVSRTGELRGYLGDRVGLKARLLALEGVAVEGNRCLMTARSGMER